MFQETEPKLSPSWNPKIICDPHPQFTEPICSSTPSEPTQIGSLGGKIELSLTLKNNLAMPGAKVKKKYSWCYRCWATGAELYLQNHLLNYCYVFWLDRLLVGQLKKSCKKLWYVTDTNTDTDALLIIKCFFIKGVFPAYFQLDVIGHIDTLLILLSPRQVHLLLDLFGAFSSGGKQLYVYRQLK